jgi:L-seryl-tRNA(Ser) seleniumtransferase
MGGGSLAEESLPSAGVAIDAGPAEGVEALARRLRTGEPAVLGRIQEGRLLLDARTVLPGEEGALIDAVVAAAREGRKE